MIRYQEIFSYMFTCCFTHFLNFFGILRHSIAVHMLDAAHTQEVKDQLGHKYIQTTDVYAAISGRKRQQIHERMERAREIVSES